MGGFALAQAQLAALFMQSIVYGIHMVTFAACISSWFRRPSGSRSSVRWMVVAVAFFVIGTCDVSFNFYHNILAFIDYKGSGGANAEFQDASSWVNVMPSVWFYLNAALSDAVLIYRCWIVYSRSRYRALLTGALAVFWLACVTCATMIVYYLSTLHVDSPIPEIPELQPFLYSFYIITVILNLFTTGCIIMKLWKVHARTASAFPRSSRVSRRLGFKDVTLIIVESALLYTVTVALCIILDLAKTNVYYGITDISLEVAGISFDLIIIRIWTGVSAEQTQAFAAPEVAPRRTVVTSEVKPGRRTSVSIRSALTDLDALELQVVVSPKDITSWQIKSGEHA